MGANDEVVAICGPDAGEGALLDVALDAMTAAKHWNAMAQLAERRAQLLYKPATLRRLAEQCAAHGHKRAAELTYARLVEVDSEDGPAWRWLAQTHHSKPALALKYWQAFFDLSVERQKIQAWQDRAAYGELILAHSGRQAEGRLQLQIALRWLETDKTAERIADRERGRLLARLDRNAEAIVSLERALKSTPCDDAVRADLVALLMSVRDFDRAAALVDPPANCVQRGRKDL